MNLFNWTKLVYKNWSTKYLKMCCFKFFLNVVLNLMYTKFGRLPATPYSNDSFLCILLLGIFCSTTWNLVEYKLLFPVVIICCILSISYYNSYDFYEVLFIKLSIVEYNYVYCKKYCWLFSYYLAWNIFCGILLTKLNVAEYWLFYTVMTRFSVKVFSNRIVQLLFTNSCVLEYQLLLLYKVFLTVIVTS